MSEAVYDVIVIGAGPVGQTLAERVRSANLSVVVVERELVGGECSYWGCVPSKALLRPVIAVSDARRVDGAREAVTGPLNNAGVFGRRDRYVTNWDDAGQAAWVKGIGADLVRGHARLDGPRRVVVDTPDEQLVVLQARQAVAVCIGSGALLPDLPGIAEARPWTNRQATESSTVPRRLAVVGGGGVGVEMATAYNGLGSQVTVLARHPGLLPRMEPFVGAAVTEAMRQAGVDVRPAVEVTEFRRPDPSGPVTVVLDDGAEVETDEVLVAAGRTPLTGDMGLETVGLTPGSWFEVNDSCQVGGVDGGWLYAAGDANHRALLTHQGKYQARMAGNAINARAAGQSLDSAAWSPHVATADHHAVPQVFFSDPEAGMVGLTAAEAERSGHRIRVVDIDPAQVVQGANLYADGYPGRARMIVDEDHGYLLGVTLIGPGVAEMLHSATIAVAGQVPIDRLWHAVPCFPTVSEFWLKLLEAYYRC